MMSYEPDPEGRVALGLPSQMTRETWLKVEIERIKAGGTIRQRCTMSTPDRVRLGWCLGDIPEDRAHRGAGTCSEQCRLDQKRLRRWEIAKNKCRHCGHGLPKPRKPRPVKGILVIPESGNDGPVE